LFPALTEASGFGHLPASYISEAIRHWADAIPELHGEGAGPDGSRLPFNRSLIFPYAFRHSYAQRHADAGTPIDVLKDLMDHRSASTTQGYYKNSQELHQPGEKPQVSRSQDRRNDVPLVLMRAL
jgi:integrase